MSQASLLAALTEIEASPNAQSELVLSFLEPVKNIARWAIREHAEGGAPSDMAVLESAARGIQGYARQIGTALAIYRTAFETMQENVKAADPYLRGEVPSEPESGAQVGTLVEIVRGMIASAEWTSDIQGLRIPTRTLDALREAANAPPERPLWRQDRNPPIACDVVVRSADGSLHVRTFNAHSSIHWRQQDYTHWMLPDPIAPESKS